MSSHSNSATIAAPATCTSEDLTRKLGEFRLRVKHPQVFPTKRLPQEVVILLTEGKQLSMEALEQWVMIFEAKIVAKEDAEWRIFLPVLEQIPEAVRQIPEFYVLSPFYRV